MNLLGERLREERQRLGLTQDALGVTPQAQRRYEKGERSPDADYLSRFAQAGADVLYIVAGERSAAALSDEEVRLIEGFRRMDERGRAGVLGLVAAFASGTDRAIAPDALPGEIAPRGRAARSKKREA